MVSGVKRFQIGRHKQHALGRLKKVSAKDDDRTRQSHKGRFKSIYTKAFRQRAKMENEQMRIRQSMGPKVGPMMKQPTFNWDTENKYNVLKKLQTRGIKCL